MTVLATSVVRAFVPVAVAGAAGNRDVSAFPVHADIVRAGIAVIIAKFDVRIRIMGTQESLANIRGALVIVIGASALDAASNAPGRKALMHTAFVAVFVADGPRVDPGQHALMGRIALVLLAIPVANALVSIALSWRRIVTDRADLHGEVRGALDVDAVARLSGIACAGALAAELTSRFDILHAGSGTVAEIDGVAQLRRQRPAIRLCPQKDYLTNTRTIALIDGAVISIRIRAGRSRSL